MTTDWDHPRPRVKLLRIADVVQIVAISESTVFRLVKKGEFPRPVKLGGNICLWPEQELYDWIAEKMNQRNHHYDDGLI